MGLKGNWTDEGYTFKIIDLDDGFYKVWALDKNLEKVGEGIFRINSSSVSWTEIRPDNSLHVTSVDVHENHQRKGLATEMYRLIEDYTQKKILPGSFQSPAAQELWKKR